MSAIDAVDGSSTGIANVRLWLLADIPAYVDLCPLLGVKRTSKSTKQLAGICAFQHAPQAQMNKGVSIALASFFMGQ